MNERSVFLAIVLFGILGFSFWVLFFRGRKHIMAAFPEDWRQILQRKVKFYQELSVEEKSRFEKAVQAFLLSVTITPIETEVSDTDRLLVAASAIIPIFGFPAWSYSNLNEILIYDKTFNEGFETEGDERSVIGMVGSGAMNRMMILSKPALRQGFENQGSKSNVGIHEFLHLIDKRDGSTDGIPKILMDQQFVIPWMKLMHEKVEEIKSNRSDINPYGATNQAEFLSVVSEYFFNQPQLLERNHPELFELLEQVFRQDLGKINEA